jgi:serine/threonine protein kinase
LVLKDKANLSHKDIKLENFVMLENSDHLVGLIDFGTAVQADKLTMDRQGTKFYAPPEAFRRCLISPTDFDVFMLGTLFVCLLFGR